jgi:hypothetical protein
MQDRGIYTVEQAADTLELTPGRIRQMLRGGDLQGSKEPGDRGSRSPGSPTPLPAKARSTRQWSRNQVTH